MTQLVELEKNSEVLAKRDTVVIAISADDQEKTDETVAKHSLTFPVLSDAELKVGKSYHVVHPTGRAILPVTYIIDPSGKIRWRFYENREPHHPPWETVLDSLDAVQRQDGYR